MLLYRDEFSSLVFLVIKFLNSAKLLNDRRSNQKILQFEGFEYTVVQNTMELWYKIFFHMSHGSQGLLVKN